MKKIYVAGKFQEKDKVLDAHEKIRDLGHKVSYDWTTHDNIKPYIENQEKANEYCVNEIEAIANSDAFVYFTQSKGTTNKMEYGAALMKAVLQDDIAIYAIGEHNSTSPWYFHEKTKRVDSLEEVIADLEREK